MRITNQMMTNSMLSHINSNKLNMNTLENQYSTGKKILKPSDDPIVAVRALKLRSNLTELSQYVEKNIPDAESWMSVTESAMDNINSIITKMNTYCVQGSSDTLTEKDRTNILQNLVQLKEQIYQEGNSQYAGRYVFTGYKTDTPLIFTSGTTYDCRTAFQGYQIKEEFTGEDISLVSMVKIPSNTSEVPSTTQASRLQLSYDSLYTKTTTDASGNEVLTSATTSLSCTVGGSNVTIPVTKTMNSSDTDAYEPSGSEVYVLADTGEIILGSDVADQLSKATSISVNYEKNTFVTSDLKPEHFFECNFVDHEGNAIKYEQNTQDITYEVNFGQTLKVNTEAKDCITHNIDRLIDDITNAVNRVNDIEKQMSEINQKLSVAGITSDKKAELEAQLEQCNMALSLGKSIMQETFAGAITTTQGFEDTMNVQIADLGARFNRLELTKDRLENQQVELEELKSSNEDVDLVETVIRYKSAEAIYTSSLQAASSVIKTNLLNFL